MDVTRNGRRRSPAGGAVLAAAALLAAGAGAATADAARADAGGAPAPAAAPASGQRADDGGGVVRDDAVRRMEPRAIRRLLVARPFRVAEPFPHAWRAERPAVRGGWLLVLEVDAALVRPRQTAMPVLYAGDQTAARVNVGHGSGRLVVIVPDELDEAGRPATPLAELPIWFGDADLPERIDAADVAAARRTAEAAGVRPRPEVERQEAIARGAADAVLEGGVAVHADRLELMRAAIDLVERHAPDEASLVEGWRLAAEAARAAAAGDAAAPADDRPRTGG